MTKDELDALRARVTASLHFGGCCVLTVWPDITALLAAVERVTAERDAFMALDTSYREQITDLNHRVNQAFRRGVAAMREAAVMAVPGHYVGQIIANLPEPEDK